MKTLRIHLRYGFGFPAQILRTGDSNVALPIKVLDEEGSTLAEVLASSQKPAEIQLTDDYSPIFVRLTWPSGRTETQRVNLPMDGPSDVTFSDAGISRNEWSAWAIPRLDQHTQLARSDKPLHLKIDRFAKVWLQIWRFSDQQWSIIPIVPSMQYKNEAARQVDLLLERYPHLLQMGGSDEVWRFVALPGGGHCRVLLTPNEANDSKIDHLKVVVTSFRTEAETLLEFLSKDAVRSAMTMANSEVMAYELFADKFQDPLAAVAGGYFLLRIGQWGKVPIQWWENLSNFRWVPDTAILHCVRLIREGLSTEYLRDRALQLFKECLDHGWPIYAEGIRLLQEAASILKHLASEADAKYFSQVETLSLAKSSAGASLSYYGREPAKPSAVLWVGMPDAPRRHQLAGKDWEQQVGTLNPQLLKKEEATDVSSISRQMTSLTFINEFSPKFARKIASPTQTKPEFEPIESDLYSRRRSPRPISQTEGNGGKSRAIKKRNQWMLLGDIGE